MGMGQNKVVEYSDAMPLQQVVLSKTHLWGYSIPIAEHTFRRLCDSK